MELANRATFTKKDGSLRTIVFYNIDQLPLTMIAEKLKGTGTQRKLADGSRLVYDLVVREFRIFNESTVIGQIEQVSLDTLFDGGYIL